MWHLGRSQNPELAQTSSTLVQGRGVDWKDGAGPFLFVFPFLFLFDYTLWHAGSQFPDQGSNPRPLQWNCRVLTTGLPGKSLHSYFLMLGFQGTRGTYPETGITPPPLQTCHNPLDLSSGQVRRCFCLSDLCSMFTKCSQGGATPPQRCAS